MRQTNPKAGKQKAQPQNPQRTNRVKGETTTPAQKGYKRGALPAAAAANRAKSGKSQRQTWCDC